MVSKSVRQSIWYSMLDSHRVMLYYTALADRYHHYDRCLQYLTLVSATGCLGAWLEILPVSWQSPVQALASVGVLLVVLWSMLVATARTEAALRTVMIQCVKVSDAWQALWIDVGRTTSVESDIIECRDRLVEAETDATRLAVELGIPINHRLNTKCAKETYQIMKDQYAT